MLDIDYAAVAALMQQPIRLSASMAELIVRMSPIEPEAKDRVLAGVSSWCPSPAPLRQG